MLRASPGWPSPSSGRTTSPTALAMTALGEVEAHEFSEKDPRTSDIADVQEVERPRSERSNAATPSPAGPR